jgi:hypothetical protein
MGFFDDVDAEGTVERHIQQVLKLEDSQSNKLLRRYKEVRQELRDRLDRAPEATFTAQQLRGVLTQVDAAIAAMTISLSGGMKESAGIFAMSGVEDSITELQKFEQMFQGAVVPINIDRQLVADETENFLLNRFEASIQAYSSDLRSSLVGSLTNESLMESSYSTVIRKLGAFFQGEEWKLHRIARTEFHNMYNLSKMNTFTGIRDSSLPDLMKTLIHPMDSRTGDDSKALARENPIVPIEEPFEQTWKGKKFVFMAPPNRPNDRAILVPYRKTWDD